ncbi:MAG: hypothetical protein WC307_02480 [Candidatus Nanoarchaeia archaeon]
MNPKIKLLLLIVGVVGAVLGALGYYLLDYCTSSPGELASQVESAVSAPLTIQVMTTIGAVLGVIIDVFVTILCPVIWFMNVIIPLFWYIIIGGVLILIGVFAP